MIILGSTADEKGTGLEKLTASLLGALGYRDIVTNEIGPGGDEIDVRGEVQMPGPVAGQTRPLVCECKAYRRPIAAPDWIKFCGKLYLLEAREGHEVYGCFIALSGMNGNAIGSVRELLTHRDNVQVIFGDKLTELVAQQFKMLAPEKLARLVEAYSGERATSLEAAYYDGMALWICVFRDGRYALRDARGRPMDESLAVRVRPMVESELEAVDYVELEKLAAARTRQQEVRSGVLQALMEGNGPATSEDIVARIASYQYDEPVGSDEAEPVLHEYHQAGWIETSGRGGYALKPPTPDSTPQTADVLRAFLPIIPTPAALTSPWFTAAVAPPLLAEVSRAQGDLPIPSTEESTLLWIIKHSPTALLTLLTPMDIIIYHRTGEKALSGERIDASDWAYLFREAQKAFVKDFERRELHAFYRNDVGIREMERVETLVVKSADAAILTASARTREGIVPIKGRDGNMIRVWILQDVPEPWEGSLGASDGASDEQE